jgi:hypothetical protein
MQLGPVRIDGNGVWLTRSGQAEQNVTVPAIVGAILMLSVLCCCARVVF